MCGPEPRRGQFERRLKAEGKPIEFRPDSAQPFDDRCLSWQVGQSTVSIWTLDGRLKDVRSSAIATSSDAGRTSAG